MMEISIAVMYQKITNTEEFLTDVKKPRKIN